jgi:DNA-directed RNA polymerase specialized sigma24 family protein
MNVLTPTQNGQEVAQVIENRRPDHLEQFEHLSFECETFLGQIIESTDWVKTTKRLLAYSRFRLFRHGTLAGRYCNKAEDYVQEAVMLFMDGTRRFPCGSGKTLFGFLCSVVDSLISHDGEKTLRRGREMFLGGDQGEDAERDEYTEEHLSANDDFEERIIADDELERFLASLAPDLVQYVRLRASMQLMTAEECAEALGTTVSEIRNMDKRLRRRRSQWNRM